jgi:hypothetical protein
MRAAGFGSVRLKAPAPYGDFRYTVTSGEG